MNKSNVKKQHKNMRDAEQLLWQYLRNRYLANYPFRYQYPIDPYIVDFVCLEKKLIIEIDAVQQAGQQAYGEIRTLVLQRQGYTLLHFSNDDVLSQTEVVLKRILKQLEALTPIPLAANDMKSAMRDRSCHRTE